MSAFLFLISWLTWLHYNTDFSVCQQETQKFLYFYVFTKKSRIICENSLIGE